MMNDPILSSWAVESIDFSTLQLADSDDDDDDEEEEFDYYPRKPRQHHRNNNSMLNDCSHADTLSTAGESSSWGSIGCEYDYDGAAAAAAADATENDDSDDDSESSLTLDDIKSFFVEDQVGIFDPTRDDLPPPKARTDYKGDSQNSFTLEDLAFDDLPGDDDDNDASDNSGSNDSLGDLFSPRRPSISASSKQRRRRKSSLKATPPLKGILKNGTCNTRRSSSLTMLLMEDSSMLQLSLTGGGLGGGDDSIGVGGDGCWSLMQQSFCNEAALDLQALEEKQVQFSTLTVYEHAVIVGDNPSVSEGVPLTLDWKALDTNTYESLEDYENERNSNNSSGATAAKTVRKLEAEERMWRLLASGVSLYDIQEAEDQVNQAREEREATKQSNLLGGQRTAFWKAIQNQDCPEKKQRAQQNSSRTRRKKSPLALN